MLENVALFLQRLGNAKKGGLASFSPLKLKLRMNFNWHCMGADARAYIGSWVSGTPQNASSRIEGS
jgi:hypothetical protein